MSDEFGKHVKKIKFGPAGKPLNFKGKVEDVPKFLNEKGLTAFEVQQVRQLNISEEQALKIREEAKKYKIKLSMHGPYAINLSAEKDEVIQASIERLIKALKIADLMGADIVVFHPGYYGKSDPKNALKTALKVLNEIEERAKSLKIKAKLGAETTGKHSQLGSLEEIIEMAREIEIVVPVIDFAHLHARTLGGFSKKKSYIEVLDKLESALGSQEIKNLHIHFSKIEYTQKGEKKHHPFGSGFGPSFLPLVEILLERKINATIISESPLLDIDALKMKEIAERYAFGKFKTKKELKKLE